MSKSSLAVIEADSVIVSMRRASTALAEAKTIQQTKKILDVAAAAEIYAQRQHLGEEAMDLAHAIKIEALRKLGSMLEAAPKNKGAKNQLRGRDSSGGHRTAPPEGDAPTLAELGLTKRESAVAQKLAEMTEAAFEQVRDGHITVAKALAAVDAAKKATAPPARKTAAPKAAPVAAHEPDDDDDGPSPEEIAEAQRSAEDDAEAVRLLIESDDKLAALAAKVKQQAAQIRGLDSRIAGLTNERDEHIRIIKGLRRKLQQLEAAA